MNNALDRAFADASRSYTCAKAAVAASGDTVFATARTGFPFSERQSQSLAAEQLDSNSGWVFACVHAIASRIAGQAVHVGQSRRIRPSKAATVVESEVHPLLTILNDPNDIQIAWSLWYFTVASLELTGRCLWWHTDLDDREQLIPIPTSWLTGFDGGASSFESFTIRPPWTSEEYSIPNEEAVYFFYPSPAGLREWASPLQAAAYAVDADEEIQRSQVSAFRHGVFPHHALIVGKTDGTSGTRPRLSGAQRKQIVRSIQQVYAGAVKSHEPLILDGLIDDVKTLSMGPSEMDWQASGAITKARICQIFGVNPIVLGEIEGANRASALAAELHMASTLNPKLRLIGDTLTEWLAPRFGGQGLKVWFDPYQPDDTDTKLQYRKLLAQYGAVTKDELRSWAGEPPLPGNLGADLLDGTETGSGSGIEKAINRHVERHAEMVAENRTAEWLRVDAESKRAKERRAKRELESSNGKHPAR